MAEPISLVNIGKGAALDLFNMELQRVLENIRNPNTDWKKVRKVVISVSIKPDETRDSGQVTLEASSTLAAATRPFKTNIFMGEEARGEHVAYESNPKQQGLFDTPEPDPKKVTPIRAEEENAQ